MDYLQLFCHELRTAGRHSTATVSAYRVDISQFQAFLNHKRQVPALINATVADIQAFAEHLLVDESSDTTVSRKLNAIASFFDIARCKDWTKDDPMQRFKMPEYPRCEARPVSEDEVVSLLKSINGTDAQSCRDRVILFLLTELGIRVSELTAIQYADLDLNLHRLYLPDQPLRRLRMSPSCVRAIRQLSSVTDKPQGLLIRNKNGTGLNVRSVRRILDKHSARTQLGWYPTPANFRHAVAARLLKEQWSLLRVAQYLGHKDPNSLRVMYHEIWVQNRDDS